MSTVWETYCEGGPDSQLAKLAKLAKLANVATLKDAIQSVSEALPKSHPYRQLIDLESSR